MSEVEQAQQELDRILKRQDVLYGDRTWAELSPLEQDEWRTLVQRKQELLLWLFPLETK